MGRQPERPAIGFELGAIDGVKLHIHVGQVR
jgi:hypothetical protein